MINAFHSNWSKPFFARNKGTKYYIEDFEILTTILSALKWREFNGSIKMITDEIAANYYKELGIEKIWDLGIETSLDHMDKNVNPDIFWAAGKLFALKKMDTPIAMIDTDFIVWKPLDKILKNEKVAVIHREELDKNVYPNKEYFNFSNGYSFNKRLNWEVKPCNTAFAYIADNSFKKYYVDSAFNFIDSVKIENNDRIKYMVFAEQRLISICSKSKNIKIKELSNLQELNSGNQDIFTHTWGFKDVMRNNPKLREKFCIRCIKRIIKDYPYMKDTIENITQLNKYFYI